MNYEELLKKYMLLVLECEGVHFVSFANHFTMDRPKFTDEEVKELQRIAKEVTA